MSYETLVRADVLARELAAGGAGWLVIDCSFDLADRGAGRRLYEAGHIPGARHADLEEVLSGAKTGVNGRHPLPDRQAFVQAMRVFGADDHTQVVAYDNAGGMFAARLWWLLRWAGHRAAAVLDGGLAAWRAAGLDVETDPPAQPAPGRFSAREPLVRTVAYNALRAGLDSGDHLVMDARAADRFRGENETLDPLGGHIPGARNRFFRDNLTEAATFRAPEELRRAFEALADGVPVRQWVNQCGSGVTACHNLLAQAVAGLPGAALYPGSWSEWSAQAGAPVATGPRG
ncbi:MAG: 3-mercaptopyruvate sulfurtransferase [Bordetella sp. SCN 67-23]|nr:sulfurtransferase [Burkholderiales bacterium]ODS72578.1 MAG: 3-mercaptopyruvate sulfurtransferase [Bordetella sp. SCN 67-23]OJW94670.1 MAG: sulfurtransferase [Burkholderiales bacterium 67-32]